MNIIGSREFQSNYQRLEEPVVVKAKSRTLGTWYPKGTKPDDDLVDAVFALNVLIGAIDRRGGLLQAAVTAE